ncbi:hypothetical protein [Providencia huashanensis]|uniref:hypothetical protein n=1 Tax=Providencia huashanensis TaxID=3037798 RepID=UPI002AFE2A39|nr:hypothetical protein [Providencia sp. 23021821]
MGIVEGIIATGGRQSTMILRLSRRYSSPSLVLFLQTNKAVWLVITFLISLYSLMPTRSNVAGDGTQ